jgi:hypothetical protein
MPVAPVARDRLDGALVADHALVLRVADGLEQRQVYDAQVIAVAVVLGQHLPVGGAAMLHPAGGELDPAFRREVAGAVDQLRGRAEVLRERDAPLAEAREDEAAIAGDAGDSCQAARALVERRVAAGVGDAEELPLRS